ncbi:diphthine--ammonia ligase [Nitrosopumilus sp. K4]|uniref:diphthine--ammonia ligase n=1 Tax=Nitrosopumilus sp. K4 TaxID=2795383 RepID=UPI001BAA25F6|nr:diphthine--ammonia ligase [Nitrosopumilus sp. K4]QUC63958.1 diphthine--ammonia ligase [Nitrosopumilus sp. K4]
MKLASLFSGGKDSTYAILVAKNQGHEIKCLLSVYPKSDESHLLHHPNLKWTKLQAKAMNIPQLTLSSNSDETDTELSSIETLLKKAKNEYGVEGLLHGGIASDFQKQKFEMICKKLNIKLLSPLWHSEPKTYMSDLLKSGFDFIITSVSSDGLDDFWLGKKITVEDLDTLHSLSEKYGFNLNFEGGEAETFVVNCPLFSNNIIIKNSKTHWDGYRGRFEIVEAGLENNA